MIHSFKFQLDKNKIYYFLYEVESGSLYETDSATFLVVKKNNIGLSESEQREYSSILQDEIQDIKQELELIDNQPAKLGLELLNKNNKYIKAMCLHICHDCNLKCEYCFAKDGTYNTKKDYMSYEVGKTAIDFLIKNSGNRKNLEVDFFGGEPLLNLDVVKQIICYAREQEKLHDKKFLFTLTTNGVLLDDEICQYLNDEMENVVISIDGRKAVHNKLRHTANKQDAYDIIVNNAKNFRHIRGDKKYYIRGTFTTNNLDFSKDVEFLNDIGFDQISMEPVVLEDSSPLAIKKEHLDMIYNEYENLARLCINRRKNKETWFNFFHFMLDLENAPCIKKRTVGCGAGSEYVAVTPVGDIFPCHQFATDVEYKMGNVFNDDFNRDIQCKFNSCNVYTKEGCFNCFAKYFCSGGCVANSVHFTGNMNKPYEIGCDMMRKRLEMALAIYAVEKNYD